MTNRPPVSSHEKLRSNAGTAQPAANATGHWTIRKRILCAFTVVTALVLAQACITFVLIRKVDETVGSLTADTLPGLAAIARIQRNAGEIQISVLRDLLPRTDEDSRKYRETIDALREDNDRIIDEYQKTVFHAQDKEHFDRMLQSRDKYGAARSRVLAMIDQGKRDEALAANAAELRPAFTAFKADLDAILDYNVAGGRRMGSEIDARANLAMRTTGLSAVLVLILSVVVATVIVRSLSRVLSRVAVALTEGSDEVAAASAQVAAASQSLAEGSSQQAASLEETSSSLEEMASMTRRNSESAAKANALARDARQVADDGAVEMQAMTVAMDAIKASGDDIAKIVKTIDEIAFQTNILALNAAVEAARAGSAGAGFAVVADEVRALAQRSAQAAKETAEKIDGSIAKTREGVGISQKVQSSLGQIVEKVRQADQLIAEVSTASTEQSQGVEQINTAVTQMDKAVQGSASSAEETASAAEELNAQAENMRLAVVELMHLVGGRQSVHHAVAPAPEKPVSVRNGKPVVARTRPMKRAQTGAPVHAKGRGIETDTVEELHFRNV